MLELRSCSVVRGGRRLVQELSVGLPRGQVCVFVGPNGAGKSTAIKLLSGELRPDGGSALIDGRSMGQLPPAALARRRAVLAQASAHALGITVRELAGLGARMLGPVRRTHVAAAVEQAGLLAAIDQPVDRLSGGERQRAHLARVLVQIGAAGPAAATTLLLDEPLAAQDLSHQLHILRLARAHATAGGAVGMVLHDLNCAAMVADAIIVLHRGRVHAAGAPHAVITAAMLADVFAIDTCPGHVPPLSGPFVLPQVSRPVQPLITRNDACILQ